MDGQTREAGCCGPCSRGVDGAQPHTHRQGSFFLIPKRHRQGCLLVALELKSSLNAARHRLLQTSRRAGAQPRHRPGKRVVTRVPGFGATSGKGVCSSTAPFTHPSGVGPAAETSALASAMDRSRALKVEEGSSTA